jgi:hypothetical protein
VGDSTSDELSIEQLNAEMELDDARLRVREEIAAPTPPEDEKPEESAKEEFSHVSTKWAPTPSVRDQETKHPETVRARVSCEFFTLPDDMEKYNELWEKTQREKSTTTIIRERQEFHAGKYYTIAYVATKEFKEI